MLSSRPTMRSRAFTLIELLIVLSVIGTVSLIAVPRYARSLERYQADAAARRIVADLQRAQARARTKGAHVTVAFDTDLDRYEIPDVPSLKDPTSGTVVEVGAAPFRATLVTAAFDNPVAADLTSDVIFDGYGMPDSGGSVLIRAGDVTRTIVLDAETGKVTIQ